MKLKEKDLKFRINSDSVACTIAYGKVFAKTLKEKDVIILEGNLGGGKTVFTKGVLSGLGYKGRVQSPSFTLIRKYKVNSLEVYHLDLYRLKLKDMFNLGIDDFLYTQKTITLVEWGGKIKQDLDRYLKIEFLFLTESSRQISFYAKGYSQKEINLIKGTKHAVVGY